MKLPAVLNHSLAPAAKYGDHAHPRLIKLLVVCLAETSPNRVEVHE